MVAGCGMEVSSAVDLQSLPASRASPELVPRLDSEISIKQNTIKVNPFALESDGRVAGSR